MKGVSWLLETPQSAENKGISSRSIRGIGKAMQQNTKWKKNTADQFACYAKIMRRSIENRLKEEDRNYSNYRYDSLRKTESIMNGNGPSNNSSFHSQRKSIDKTMFTLHKKEKDLEMQV